jgi:Ser/Thr protein kinase RdoA (MazF antagonist)
VDEPRDIYWLFLERVFGHPLSEEGDLAVWEKAAGWLGRFHRRQAHLIADVCPEWGLINMDACELARWWPRARVALHARGEHRLDSVLANGSEYVEQLARLPRTVLHGDFYASNILVSGGGGERICPVDWDRAAVGPGELDLAALLAGAWSDGDRQALARAYLWASLESPPEAAMLDSLLGRLDLCRLQLAVQWLGWSERWAPPPEHAWDWLDDALRTAKRLDLLSH